MRNLDIRLCPDFQPVHFCQYGFVFFQSPRSLALI